MRDGSDYHNVEYATVERYRDSRPDARVVHETLLDAMLYLRDRGLMSDAADHDSLAIRIDGKEVYHYGPSERPGPGEIAEAVKAECW